MLKGGEMYPIEVRGNHYQIGLQIGQATSAKIAKVLPRKKLSPGIQKRLNALVPLHREAFPTVFDELEGMAEGSGQDSEKLLAWNFLESGLLGCTDILSLDGGFLAHNEDGPALFEGLLTLVRAEFPNGESFVSLQYPGMLMGNTVSMNSAGLVSAVNTLLPRRLARVGYSSNFLARALLEAQDLGEAGDLLARHRPRIDAYHWFAYSRSEGRALSIEVLQDWESVEELTEGVHFHTNHYLHPDTSGEPQEDFPSSRDRSARLGQLLTSRRTGEPALSFLSDHEGKWPICRHGNGDSLTLANAIVDLKSLRMRIAQGPTCRIREYLTASV